MRSGSIATNPNKIKLMQMIAKKGQSLESLAKKIRIPIGTARDLLEELVSEGFVLKDGEVYKLSGKGEKAIKEIGDVGGKGR